MTKKNNYIALSILLGLRLLLLTFNININSSAIEIYLWIFIFISFYFNTTLNEVNIKKRKRYNIFNLIGLVFLIYLNISFVVKENTNKPILYKNFNKYVWEDFDQQAWGGKPHCYDVYGQSYLNGLFTHQEEKYELDCENILDGIEKYKAPKNINFNHCYFNKKIGLLFDTKNKICYQLKKNSN